MNRVVVVVEGGVVQATYARDPSEIEIEVVDVDDLKAEGFGRRQIDNLIDAATSGLKLKI